MYTQTNRRVFLRAAGLGAVGLSLGGWKRAFAQTANDQILLTVFLRGASDGMSWLHPRPGTSAARQRYETWRGAGTRIAAGISVPGSLAMHPALSPLRPIMQAGRATLVGGVAGAVENRSHFQQQDLVESGANGGTPRADGVIGRAMEQLALTDQGLAAIALNTQPPFIMKSTQSAGLAAPDLRSFGPLRHPDYVGAPNLSLQRRLRNLYVPASGCANSTCEAGAQASDALATYAALSVGAGLGTGRAGSLGELLRDLARLIAVDTTQAFKFVNVDIGGWDTHLNQGTDVQSGGNFAGTLAKNLNALASALAGFHDEAVGLGCWNRVTVLVMTEFGRTTYENGTGGTDHGYGGAAVVMGSGLRAQVLAPGYFPGSVSNPFYATAESSNALPRIVEHRQLLDEILRQRFGLGSAAMGAVLPSFSRDPAIPALFA